MTTREAYRQRQTLFVERQTYRRRRLIDAARLLPVLGLLLWAVPLLWPAGPGEGIATSRAILYVFGIWAGLVLAALVLAQRLRGNVGAPPPGPPDAPPGRPE